MGVETEEVVEEPEELVEGYPDTLEEIMKKEITKSDMPKDSVDYHGEPNNETTVTRRIIRRRIIKKIIYINGEPVETEEIVEEPEELTTTIEAESEEGNSSTIVQHTTKTIKKVIYVDGKATEVEEYVAEDDAYHLPDQQESPVSSPTIHSQDLSTITTSESIIQSKKPALF